MKRTFSVIALVLAFSLTACSKEEVTKNYFNIRQKIERKDGRAVILPPPVAPQAPEFPTEAEIQAKIAENLAYINSKIVEKDGKTTYYFVTQKDKDGKNIYPLTDDKNKADYYRVILGKTKEGFCAVQDYNANGNKQIEPFIERDIEFCNRLDSSDKPLDRLVDIYYGKEGKIKSFTYLDIKNKQRFVFGYNQNGEEKAAVRVFDISEPSNKKLTEFYFNENGRDDEYKSSISVAEFNGEEIVKSGVFLYFGTHLKNIDCIIQYNHIAQDKKQIMWFPQKDENVAVYVDDDPKYGENNKKLFDRYKKWMKYTEEEFNFRLSQNSNNQ